MQFLTNIAQSIRSFGQFVYNRKNHQILGRDGKQWSRIEFLCLDRFDIFLLVGKLAAFYFFFYITLGGFFCLYLAIFMSLLPLNRPRYIGKDSLITSRSHPFSPGLKKKKIDDEWTCSPSIQGLVFDHKLARIFMMYKHWSASRLIIKDVGSGRISIALKFIQRILMNFFTIVSDTKKEHLLDQRMIDCSQIIAPRLWKTSPSMVSMIVIQKNNMVLEMVNHVF